MNYGKYLPKIYSTTQNIYQYVPILSTVLGVFHNIYSISQYFTYFMVSCQYFTVFHSISQYTHQDVRLPTPTLRLSLVQAVSDPQVAEPRLGVGVGTRTCFGIFDS